ncbi:MAG TPA: efflux RND transporter periplasmic adaptor subunit [Aggregatilineales bacterium]|nr:efflux RND transporter periplasmic adaptor subunit [Aggregatilineales bacterium]
MSKLFKIVLFIGSVLVIGAAAVRSYGTSTPAAAASIASVETTSVDRGDIPIVVNATGTIQASQNVALAFNNSGIVTAITVKAGDAVRKGQTIATIENTSAVDAVTSAQVKVQDAQTALDRLNAKPRQIDVDVAQANLAVQQANLSETQHSGVDPTQLQIDQINVEQAKNNLWQAELQRDATKQKLAANPKTSNQAQNIYSDPTQNRTLAQADSNITVAQDQLSALQSSGGNAGGINSAQASVDSAQAQLNALLAPPNPDDVKQAQSTLASAQSALDQAKQTLAETNLVAPFDGVVAQINMNVGEPAPSSQDAVLLDTHSFYVDLPVAELDIAKIKVGQDADMHFEALPSGTIPGKVTLISTAPNTGTPITYTVRVEIASQGQPLLSTMSTTASIILANATNVLRLPNRFIRIDRQANKAYATVLQSDGSYLDVQIQLGTSNDSYTEIKSGLKEGDVVAVAGAKVNSGNGGGGGNPLRRIFGG